MAISSLEAAKALGEYSGWSVSNLQMQKILYIAHMFFLGSTGQKLISEPFEAWDYGPVIPSLYRKAKVFGSSDVQDIFYEVPHLDDNKVELLHLREAATKLVAIPPMRLVALTHRTNGAWDKNYKAGVKGIKIPDADILQEYKSLSA